MDNFFQYPTKKYSLYCVKFSLNKIYKLIPKDYFILDCIGFQLKQLREKAGKQGKTEPIRSNITKTSSMTETKAINNSSHPPLSVSINRPISELFSFQYQDSDDEKVNFCRKYLNDSDKIITSTKAQ